MNGQNKNIEQAPIMNQKQGQDGMMTNFKGAGNSHFSHVEGQGFHETTTIGGTGHENTRVHTPIITPRK